MKCFACELPAAYDGFCEGCYGDLFAGSDDAMSVANKLTAIINEQNVELVAYERIVIELNAALAAQHDLIAKLKNELAEATHLLEQAHDRINLLEEAHNDSVERNAALAGTLAVRDQRIAELEAQLAAALATIEAAMKEVKQ